MQRIAYDVHRHRPCVFVLAARYLERTVEVAQQVCAGMAAAGNVKGEDSMKAFTFQVCCMHDLTLLWPQRLAQGRIHTAAAVH